jgi:ABC-type nitrate/sulfonate/bicarbonate transport system permease component
MSDARGTRFFWPKALGRWLTSIETLAPVMIVGVLLAFWEAQSRAGNISSLFFPAPSKIAIETVRDLLYDDLASAAWLTLRRSLSGLTIGGTVGLLLGFGMGRSAALRSTFDPLIALLHPIPKLALFPLALIIFGLGETAFSVVIGLAAFFPMAITTMAGVRQLDPLYFDVAAVYDKSPLKVLTRVLLPGTLPVALAGARLALNSALVVTVALEITMPNSGLGSVIWRAWETLVTTRLYSGIFLISVIGLSLNALLSLARRRLVPWEE